MAKGRASAGKQQACRQEPGYQTANIRGRLDFSRCCRTNVFDNDEVSKINRDR